MSSNLVPAEVEYWNGYARWYERWRTHNDYHGPIIEELKRWVRPGWRILDIGAAEGALALPLSLWGCRVTALEPAGRLRESLAAEVRRLGIPGPAVSEKTWEEYGDRKDDPYNLVLACNSLHLMAGGFRKALAKIFALKPRRVLVVAEARGRDCSTSINPATFWNCGEIMRPTATSPTMTCRKPRPIGKPVSAAGLVRKNGEASSGALVTKRAIGG